MTPRVARYLPSSVAISAGLILVTCRSTAVDPQPVPVPDRAPWYVIYTVPGFRVAMDTTHLSSGPGGVFVWYVNTHATPQGPDSMRFDRSRIELLVRCEPLAFKSVREDLALGDALPVFHQDWPLTGPRAAAWRVPEAGSTDGQFLRTTCRFLRRRGA